MKKTILLLFLLLSTTFFSHSQTVSPLQVCDDNNDGYAMFNLTNAVPEILAGLNPSLFNVYFYTTATDAALGANSITNPSIYFNNVPNTQIVYFTIVNTQNNEITIDSMLLNVNANPIISQRQLKMALPIITQTYCQMKQERFS